MMRVTGIRVDIKQDEAIITALGQSPRGTRVRLKRAVAKGKRESREIFQENVLKAIKEVLPSKPSVNE